ncbi:ABC transporter ATP-binding protein [Butyrivibrio sp. XB500-5]|uniref:ABC transporter ATP-binding protein n=1 Tax=Butyrivibrio sp. XB500-5 TaxID=2364880 RepID=UPI000EA92B5E|nr:ABC transporter ATP-binding protein [Butyrivibrio sp. XB500-5]RKM63320.1 ABC transporter ATP-binding protein [Butyrivibrio sp. XB500-5]
MGKEHSRIEYAVRLGRYIKGYGFFLFIAIMCNLIFIILPLGISFVMSLMISKVFLQDLNMIKGLLALLIGLIIADAVFSYLDILVSHDVTYRILTKLRDLTYDKISELSPAAMMGKQSGDYISTIIEDVELLEWFYAHVIAQLVVAFCVPVIMLLSMGMFSAWIPVAIIPFIISMLMIPKFQAAKANKQGSKVRSAAGKVSAEIVDGVQGLRDILSFGWNGQYLKRFKECQTEYQNAFLTYEKRSAFDSSLLNLIVAIAGFVADILTVILVKNGTIPAKFMLPIFLMSSGVFVPIMEAMNMSNNYGLIFGAAKRVVGLLETEPAVKDEGTLTKEEAFEKYDLNSNKHYVELSHVGFGYPEEVSDDKTDVLKDISFYVDKGETVAIVGASGCGKSTISKLLLRFWDTDRGSVFVAGFDIKDYKLSELQRMITLVPQEAFIFADTVENNIMMAAPGCTREQMKKAAQLAGADKFIEKLTDGYQTTLGEHGLRLSGGEKKRIAIAQAMLKDSPILVLDEASANLDAENERIINMGIENLKKGRATIMIAHRISTIRSADRVMFIKDGCVDEEGKFDDLIANNEDFRKLIASEEAS